MAGPAPRTLRIPAVDQLRGLAVVAMVVYHFAWFCDDAGLVELAVRRSPGWRSFQRAIAGTFFGLVGVGLVLAGGAAAPLGPMLRRLGRIAAGAAVVTAASLVLDPRRVVVFGILHSIAVCSLIGRPLLRLPTVALAGLGAALVAAGAGLRLAAFDHPALHWTGLSPRVPPTFDIQPLLPWLGVVLWGAVLGRALRDRAAGAARAGVPGALGRGLGWLGRHSLWAYMAHVPVLVGIVALLLALS